MTFDAYWTRLQNANPGLLDPQATMSIRTAAFRDVVRRAYQQGREDATKHDDPPHSSMPDFFKGLFGGKR